MIKYKSVYISLFFLFSIFLIMVFKNIQFPLLWNDEADTVVFAQRILSFGYPKVHDGRNVSNHFVSGDPKIAVKNETDAYIGSGWTQFYFAAPFVGLAEGVKDIYLKTAILRIPFTTAGVIGLLFLAAAILPVFGKRKTRAKFYFLIFFALFEITSIYLTLHLRQVRSHPLVLLLSSILIFLFIRHNFFGKIGVKIYIVLEISLLFLLFNTFYPAFFVFLATFFIHEFYKFITAFKKRAITKTGLRKFVSPNILIYILSLFLALPLIVYFEIPKINLDVSKHFSYGFYGYVHTLITIVRLFLSSELLLAVVVLKGLIAFSSKRISGSTSKIVDISRFLSIFFFVYVLLIALNPNFYFRYVITLQPVLVIIFLLDFLILMSLPSTPLEKKRYWKLLLLGTSAVFAFVFLIVKLHTVKEYLYEISHPYKGPLDYIIPYISTNYDKPENLVIATNYEEQSLMYYLGSKVIIGHIGNNLEEDLKEDPDIIIPRKLMTGKSPIYELISRGGYIKKSFEIFDYPVNNIPEIALSPKHLYRTKFATNEEDKLEIFKKQK